MGEELLWHSIFGACFFSKELKLKKKGYNEVALRGMNVTWAFLDTKLKFPHRKHWIICAGSFFWVKKSYMWIWDQHLVPAVPRILAQSANYSTGCAARLFLWEGVRFCKLGTDHALIQKQGKQWNTYVFVNLVQWKYKRAV